MAGLMSCHMFCISLMLKLSNDGTRLESRTVFAYVTGVSDNFIDSTNAVSTSIFSCI